MRICERFLLFIPIIILLLNNLPVSATTGLSVNNVWQKLNSDSSPLLIDNRTPEAYEISHIPTAINIPYDGDLDESTADLIRGFQKNEIIIYCSCDLGVSAQEMAIDLEEHQLSVMYMDENFNYWPYDTVSGPNPGSLEKIDVQTSNQIESNDGQSDIGPFFAINLLLLLIIVPLLIVKKVKS